MTIKAKPSLLAQAARLVEARTPQAHLHNNYLRRANYYSNIHAKHPPQFRLRGKLVTGSLEFHRSILFGRDYLVAWIEESEAFVQALPSTDAAVSPIRLRGSENPLPLILAPVRRRTALSQEFLEILEHEIVHVNQQLMGMPAPSYSARSAADLLDCFFADIEIEYEAHLIQYLHWPPRPTLRRVKLTLNQWVLLRAHTQAVEEVFRRTAKAEILEGIVPRFLSEVPKQAPQRLQKLGCTNEVVRWFQSRWANDIAIAIQVVTSQGVDLPALSCVTRWLEKWKTRTSDLS